VARIDGTGVGGIGAARILYEDVAQLEALKADLEKGQAPRAPRRPGAGTAALLGRVAGSDPLLDGPPPPRGWTRRPDGRDLGRMLRRAAAAAEESGSGGAVADLAEVLRSLATARDRAITGALLGRRA
jgi:hypothetical protein